MIIFWIQNNLNKNSPKCSSYQIKKNTKNLYNFSSCNTNNVFINNNNANNNNNKLKVNSCQLKTNVFLNYSNNVSIPTSSNLNPSNNNLSHSFTKWNNNDCSSSSNDSDDKNNFSIKQIPTPKPKVQQTKKTSNMYRQKIYLSNSDIYYFPFMKSEYNKVIYYDAKTGKEININNNN